MKNLILSVLFAMIGVHTFAQSIPNTFSYQGQCIQKNTDIELEFILKDASDNAVYKETKTVRTTDNGSYTVTVGEGAGWDQINWGVTGYTLTTKINGAEVSECKLTSVPYANMAADVVGLNELREMTYSNRDFADFCYNDLRNRIDHMDMDNISLADSLMVVKYDVSENKKFLDYLEQMTKSNQNMIMDIWKQIEDNRFEIYNLHERANQIDSLSEQLSEIKEFVSNIANIDIDNIENIIGDRLDKEIDKRIEDLQRVITENIARIYALEDKSTLNRDLIYDLEKQVFSNKDSIEELKSLCKRLEEMILENEARVKDTEANVMWHIEHLQKEIDALKNN